MVGKICFKCSHNESIVYSGTTCNQPLRSNKVERSHMGSSYLMDMNEYLFKLATKKI